MPGVGDRVRIESTKVGQAPRDGVVIAVLGQSPSHQMVDGRRSRLWCLAQERSLSSARRGCHLAGKPGTSEGFQGTKSAKKTAKKIAPIEGHRHPPRSWHSSVISLRRKGQESGRGNSQPSHPTPRPCRQQPGDRGRVCVARFVMPTPHRSWHCHLCRGSVGGASPGQAPSAPLDEDDVTLPAGSNRFSLARAADWP